jgi:proliferating cell nuclear antigen PCNA
MTLNPAHGDKASIELTGAGSIEKSFEFPLIDIDSQLLDIPDNDHQADITIRSTQFSLLVGQLSIFSDMVTFKCTQDDIHMTAAGDSGTMTAKIQDDDIDEYAIEEGIDLSVSYSLPYVKKMCAFARLSPIIYLHCSAARPMKINYPLDGQPDGKNYMRFFLAPRLETDD